jgi:hypothetical protein
MSVKQIHEEIEKHNLTLTERMALVQLLMHLEWEEDKKGNLVMRTGWVNDPYASNGVSLDLVCLETGE